MRLEEPTEKHKESFLEAVNEYLNDSDIRTRYYRDLNLADLERDFPTYLAKLSSDSQGINLAPGYVPQTVYWLIDNDAFIGRVSIRHVLNDYLRTIGGHIGYDIRPTQRGKGFGKILLKLALPKAQEIGIEKALITCDINNIPSKKVIEANGGFLESTFHQSNGEQAKLRYWIDLHL